MSLFNPFQAPSEPPPDPAIVFTQTSGPASEPVSAATFRAYAHIDSTLDADAELNALLLSARHVVERATGRILVAQSWQAKLERWPAADPHDGRIRIRLSPAPVSITSVSVDGTALASTFYTLAGDELVVSADLEAFPEGDTITDGVTIVFAASPAATAYPQLLTAIQMIAAHWHRNPEASHTFEAGLSAMPLGVAAIFNSARVMRELN